jgi:cytochrome c
VIAHESMTTLPTRFDGHTAVGLAFAFVLAMGLTSCADKFDYARGAQMTGGDPQAGKEKIIVHDCHSCHAIPGIPLNTDSRGPALKHWSRQTTIAKQWPNNPANLEDFIEHPDRMLHGKSVKSEITMANIKPADAKDIAAYLFSID